MKDSARDAAIDRMLMRMGVTGAAPHACPDFEVLAAWVDQSLSGDERAGVERHVSDCTRCQAQLAAIARIQGAGSEERAPRVRARWIPWLVPVAGGAAALTVWFIARPPTAPQAPSAPRELQVQQDAHAKNRVTPPLPPAGEETRTTSSKAAPLRQQNAELKKERREIASVEEAPAAARSAAPASRPMEMPDRLDASDTSASEARLSALVVRRGDDGTVTWDRRSSPIALRITAGASPSASVIWLAGKGGLVLLTVDGHRWRRVPFPLSVDLTAVQASSATEASVTTTDGRTFTTRDGGQTWIE